MKFFFADHYHVRLDSSVRREDDGTVTLSFAGSDALGDTYGAVRGMDLAYEIRSIITMPYLIEN